MYIEEVLHLETVLKKEKLSKLIKMYQVQENTILQIISNQKKETKQLI